MKKSLLEQFNRASRTRGNSADAGNADSIHTNNVPSPWEGELENSIIDSHMLGEAVWLLTQSRDHQHFNVSDINRLILPAVHSAQCRIFYGKNHPVGFAIWAHISEAVENRIANELKTEGSALLVYDDWQSGDRLWLVEFVAPFSTQLNKHKESMLTTFIDDIVKGRSFKLIVRNSKTLKREIKVVGATDEDQHKRTNPLGI